MKSRIKYSGAALFLTVILFAVLIAGCCVQFDNKPAFYCLLSILLILTVFALLYGASYLKVTDDFIYLGSPLKCKKIPVRDIVSVELLQPTMGAYRIFASGGFMGYWGIFSERDLGRYYAFYGKGSDCFLIRMKNGDKYLLGCKNPAAMVARIQSMIKAG